MLCWAGPHWNGANADCGESVIYRETNLEYTGAMTPDEAIEILWNYHHVGQELHPADLIFVLGSNDVRVAEYAAELYKRHLAPVILFSGGMGRFTGGWAVPEAELFAEAAIKAGVPENCILIENKSTNTGENVRFSREVLKRAGIGEPVSLIALQKPYMERRTLATLQAQWPEARVAVSSPPVTFRGYLTAELPQELVVSAMVGDFQRILEYPRQGFSTEQPVTPEAMEAFRTLVEAGYDSQLLRNIPLPWNS
ncbi:MAG: YdcF family protein [Akkermansia sp.]